MNFLRIDNYISIEGLINRIIAKQNDIKERYFVTNTRDLMNVISTGDLKEWQTLKSDLDYLTPIYNKQKVT